MSGTTIKHYPFSLLECIQNNKNIVVYRRMTLASSQGSGINGSIGVNSGLILNTYVKNKETTRIIVFRYWRDVELTRIEEGWKTGFKVEAHPDVESMFITVRSPNRLVLQPILGVISKEKNATRYHTWNRFFGC